MTVLRIFLKCSILQPVFEALCRNIQNVSGCIENDSFKEEISYPRPTCRICAFQGRFFLTPIKQIRGFVGFILQPEMKLLENRPRPLINIERDESSQTHLIVSTTLRSFRDKVIHTCTCACST